ncbi:MAG TPA: DNA polymerase III subunit beta [Clostridiales bacterium]|nr:DNA polymerase III subunit beta [Clostridiales bacterium]
MKIFCNKDDLVNAINTVQKAVPAKTTLPILQGIMVKAEDNLKLTANDLEMAIECSIKAEIIEKGSIVIDSKLFGEIIRRMPNSEVHIEVDNEENIKIDCKNSKFEIKGTKSEGFPGIQEIQEDISLKASQSVIRDMIRQTIFAVGEDENRLILTGSLIECKNGLLTFVSIDGFRLALRKCIIEDQTAKISVIVPGKTLNEISKILNPVEDDVNIYASKSMIMFDMGDTKVVSRLLEGEYFKYENVIPEEFETKIRINKKELQDSIERASLLISSDGSRYPVTLLLKSDKLIITTNTQIGNAREEINIDIWGDELEIKFNPRYFIDSLKAIEEENVDVMFSSDVGPCILKSVDKDTFIYMILPLRK